MDSWRGKVALVTGASSGIGKAIALKLASHNMKVIGCARNMRALEAVAEQAKELCRGEIVAIKCDVEKEQDILDLFKFIDEKYSGIHVLINNAGLAHDCPLLSGKTEDWNQMLAVNVLAPTICSREAVKLMTKHGIDDGYVVNINSTSGHAVDNRPAAHFYQVTKFAVTALSDGLRRELVGRGSRIRVTSISPGHVESDFVNRWYQREPGRAAEMLSKFTAMPAEDLAETVVYALSSPRSCNICELLVKSATEY